MSDIQIYVADLAAYNNGILHGVWIDATLELDDIYQQVKQMLKQSPVESSEEIAVHDYEGFGSYSVSEYSGLEELHNVACFIERHGELGAKILSHCCDDLDKATKMLEENYNGEYESVADYARQLTEDTGDIPKHLEFYIDYEKMGRDMEISGDIFTIEMAHNEVHIFWNH